MRLAVILMIALGLFAYNISPELNEHLRSIHDEEIVDVIFHLTGRPDLNENISSQEKIYILKNYTDSIYAPYMDHLIELKKSEEISFRTTWLVPSLIISGEKGVILQLADDIQPYSIIWNREYNMLHGIQEATEAMEITWGVEQINAPAVWALGFTGEGVSVGIFDTGIRYTHHDIADRMWTNPGEIPDNSTDDDGNGYIDDYYGYDFVNSDGDPWDDNNWTWHGTHCAGTVAGDGSSGTETGVAPGARVAALKVINSTGSGVPADVEEALEYAADMGIDVFSMSIGWEDPSESLSNYFRAIFENLLDLGIITSVSAGNGSGGGGHYTPPQDISAPADCPSPWYGSAGHTSVIAVGATDDSDNIASFSSYGPTEWGTAPYDDYPSLIKPDVTAPGVSITSLSGYNDYSYRGAGGTSMACPHVAGAIALILSKAPYLTPRQVDSLLQTTALDLGDAGRDNYYGNGRIQVDLAIEAAPAPPYPLVGYFNHLISDPTGNDNGVADIGEVFGLIVTLKNTGLEQSGINCAITSPSTYISITDNTSSYGTLGTNESGNNAGDPFDITVLPSASPGTEVVIVLNITGTGGYSRIDTLTFSIANYPRAYYDLPFGSSNTLSVTNFGSIGFFDPTASSALGSGFDFEGYNYLYSAYLFLGLSPTNVATGEEGTESDFIPICNMDDSYEMYGDNEVFCQFVEPGSGLIIDQRAISWNGSPNNDFVLLRYQIFNPTDSPVDYIIGFFADYDILYSGTGGWMDRASYNASQSWAFMWDNSATPENDAIVGIADLASSATGSIINNSFYIYPSGMGWTDEVKYDFLDGTYSFNFADADSDWSVILTKGEKTILPGELDTVVFIMAGGSSEADFGNNIAQARALSPTVLSTFDEKPESLQLTVSPNPFNSSLHIDLPMGAKSLKINDLSGKCIEQIHLSGQKRFIWHPYDLPSGLYIVQVSTPSYSEATKALLIR